MHEAENATNGARRKWDEGSSHFQWKNSTLIAPGSYRVESDQGHSLFFTAHLSDELNLWKEAYEERRHSSSQTRSAASASLPPYGRQARQLALTIFASTGTTSPAGDGHTG